MAMSRSYNDDATMAMSRCHDVTMAMVRCHYVNMASSPSWHRTSPFKGVGEGGGRGQRGLVPPHFQKWGGGTSGFVPPLLDRSSLISPFLNFLLKFFVKNAKFSWLASLANLTLFIFFQA